MRQPHHIFTIFRRYVSGKLGRCERCIRIAVFAAVAAWAGTALSLGTSAPPPMVVLSLAAAAALTALVAAHVIALVVRLIKDEEACGECGAGVSSAEEPAV